MVSRLGTRPPIVLKIESTSGPRFGLDLSKVNIKLIQHARLQNVPSEVCELYRSTACHSSDTLVLKLVNFIAPVGFSWHWSPDYGQLCCFPRPWRKKEKLKCFFTGDKETEQCP